ncbi:hypothetical protein [Trichlorobacter thiogenes]|uniref:hypothetical protein n=1 Tax=Trichlorobacter thiogenes TaxID=115783 RepID=UPI00137A053A|nr:hypothetical protein [Trichlorobacter thiogenes]
MFRIVANETRLSSSVPQKYLFFLTRYRFRIFVTRYVRKTTASHIAGFSGFGVPVRVSAWGSVFLYYSIDFSWLSCLLGAF